MLPRNRNLPNLFWWPRRTRITTTTTLSDHSLSNSGPSNERILREQEADLEKREREGDLEKKEWKPLSVHPPIWFTNRVTNSKFQEVVDPDILKKLEEYRQELLKEVNAEPALDEDKDKDGEQVGGESAEEHQHAKGAIEYAR